uniref:Uncharacterized protein n=1 Tax=Glossina austeni TaxID=7395 RepID=A0A1A9V946_GLOAU
MVAYEDTLNCVSCSSESALGAFVTLHNNLNCWLSHSYYAIMLNFYQNFRHNLTYSSLITTPLPVRSDILYNNFYQTCLIKCDLHTNEFLFPQSEDEDMLTLLFCWLQLEIRISEHMKLLRAVIISYISSHDYFSKIFFLRLGCCQEISTALIKICRTSTSPPLHRHAFSSLGSLMVHRIINNGVFREEHKEEAQAEIEEEKDEKQKQEVEEEEEQDN